MPTETCFVKKKKKKCYEDSWCQAKSVHEQEQQMWVDNLIGHAYHICV